MSSEEIHIKLNYISKIVGNQLQFEWTTIKVQVCKHLEHWSLKMVLLYNDKTAVDVPDCKMMKILVGSELLDRYCSTISRYASRPSSKVSEKSDFLFQRPWFGAIQHQVLWKSESAVHVGRPPALKLKNWKTEKQKKSQIPWKQGLTLHKGLSPLVFVGNNAQSPDKAKPFCTYNRDSACNELCAWQDGNKYLRIKWARLFSPLKRNQRVPAEMIVLSETST